MSKKSTDLRLGTEDYGRFRVTVCRRPFDTAVFEDIEFFEVRVTEQPRNFYVHLVDDPRFGLLSHVGRFERPLTADDVMTYDTYVWRKQLTMPGWVLSRRAVIDLIDTCKRA